MLDRAKELSAGRLRFWKNTMPFSWSVKSKTYGEMQRRLGKRTIATSGPRAHVQAVLACAPFAFGVIPGRKWLQIGDPSETRFAIG